MGKGLVILFIIILALLARIAYVTIPASGWLIEHEEIGTAQCQAITIAPGTEDIVYDAHTNLVFVSTTQRRSGQMNPANGIYAFALDEPSSVKRVSLDAPAEFKPHGISLYRDDNTARLFVISHPSSGDQVLIFDIGDEGMLTHVDTVRDPAVRQANDIQATGPDSFYVTNDVYFGDNTLGYIEAFLGLPLGGISYYDGETGRSLTRGFRYANGIHVSNDGQHVYASAFLGREVHIFDREPDNDALKQIKRYRIALGLDNISLDENGMIYIAGNPNVFAFMAHQAKPDERAPSQVVRIDPETGQYETVFYNDGLLIDSASVALPVPGQLLIGAVFDDHVLMCPRPT